MNKLNKSILMAFVALATFGGVKAQSKIPQYVTFQAVARDDNNKPIVKQPIQVKLIITQGSSTGTPVYGAIYEDSTNLNGEFSRILGSYTPSSLTGINDKFENIPWEKGDMWVNIEYKSAIVGSFKKMGSFQFLAQPYAFSSKYAEKLNVTATQGQVLTFDGTNWVAKDANTTAQKLTVAGTTGQVLTYDGTNWVAKDAPKFADASWTNLKDKPTLAPVATSGNFNDLKDKPTIATNTSELNNDAGFGVFMPGMIMPWAGDATTVPSGWMMCDGTVLNKTDYPKLFDVIQTFYGQGNGTTGSFNLPDYRGMFLRGANNGVKYASSGKTVDPDANSRLTRNNGNYGDKVGSIQFDAFQGHSHNLKDGLNNKTGKKLGAIGWMQGMTQGMNLGVNNGAWAWSDVEVQEAVSDGINGDIKSSTETRPMNIYVNYIIKVN